MKTFRKIEFNSSRLNHEEMKSIKAGTFEQAYGCNMDTSGGTYTCSNLTSSCFTSTGAMGYCVMTYVPPRSYSCACE